MATVYGLNVTGVNANPGWITVYESTCGNIVAEVRHHLHSRH